MHNNQLLDLAYQKPDMFFSIPPEERENRIKIDSDLCVIDDKYFFIRGVLPLSIPEIQDEFRWGIWAEIRQKDFEHYLEIWDVDKLPDYPLVVGRLAGIPKSYPWIDEAVEVEVEFQIGSGRPRFKVIDSNLELGQDQINGISMKKVHTFTEGMRN